jgi:hypothetical protein
VKHGTWSSNSNHFHEKVVAKSEEFASLSRGERLLVSIGELQKLLGVRPRDLRTPLDLAEGADDICMAAVRVLRDDKDAKFTGNNVDAMIEFEITKIFGGLNIRMEELSSDLQQSLVDRVREFLRSLPADQQRFIMDKIGAADLSESAIRQAIASGAIWTAFVAAVQVFGFAFYMTAAQLLAIVSLHMLPFGAYVGLSSTIAVLSSPWMLPIFAGLGIWYYSRKNRGLRQSMAPLIVTSLCLSGMEIQARPASFRQSAVDEALSLWVAARSSRDQKRSATESARSTRDQAKARLTATRNELAQTRTAKEVATSEWNRLNQELAPEVLSAVGEIAKGQWGGSLIAAAKAQVIQAEICRSRQKSDRKSGFWETIGAYIDDRVDALDLKGQLGSEIHALVQQVKSAWQREGTSYPANAASLLRSMEEKTSRIILADADINRLTVQERDDSRKLDDTFRDLRIAEASQALAEQRYHGLGAV